MLEFACIFALLVMILLGAGSIGEMLRQHFVLSAISQEGARAASMVPGLSSAVEVRAAPSEKQLDECWEALIDPFRYTAEPCALYLAYQRVSQLVELQGMNINSASIAWDGAKIISVQLNIPGSIFFTSAQVFTIGARASMPYLAAPAELGDSRRK